MKLQEPYEPRLFEHSHVCPSDASFKEIIQSTSSRGYEDLVAALPSDARMIMSRKDIGENLVRKV